MWYIVVNLATVPITFLHSAVGKQAFLYTVTITPRLRVQIPCPTNICFNLIVFLPLYFMKNMFQIEKYTSTILF